MNFMLYKKLCAVTQVVDSKDCPPDDGTEYYPGDFSIYYNPLYHPECHADLFRSPESVCEWLKHCFRSESLWSDVYVEFHEGFFYIEDISVNIQLRLSPLDIASSRFHPWLYLHMDHGNQGCNLSWVYTSEESLSDAFDGITLRSMVTVTGKLCAAHTRADAIAYIAKWFAAFSRHLHVMDDPDLEALCCDVGIVDIPMVNRRRYMIFSLFQHEFGDVLFPKIIRPRSNSVSYPKMYGNHLLQSIDPELDYMTLRWHVHGISNKMLTEYPTCIHASRHIGCRTDSHNCRIEHLCLSMLAQW